MIGKTLQSLISGALTFIFLNYTFFTKVLTITVSTVANTVNSYEFTQLISTIICLFLFIVVFKVMQIITMGDS